MKLKQVYEELMKIASDVGIKVLKGNGSFRGGYCIVKDEDLIILNKTATLEVMSSVLARSLLEKNIDNVFVKPVIREFIEKERDLFFPEREFVLEVKG